MSIRKRRWVAKSGQAHERWVADTKDIRGKRFTATFETRKEAVAFDHHHGVAARLSQISFAQACEKWIDRCREKALTPATIARYQACLTLHVVPFMGRLRLADLTPDTIRKIRGQMIENGHSEASVTRAFVYVARVLKSAQKEGHVSRNVWRWL